MNSPKTDKRVEMINQDSSPLSPIKKRHLGEVKESIDKYKESENIFSGLKIQEAMQSQSSFKAPMDLELS